MLRSALQWVIRGLAVVAALLATVQPVLGPLAFFRGAGSVDYATLHLVTGGILYNIVLLLAVAALFARFRRRWLLVAVWLAQYALVHLQLRLGLGANEDAGLLAYHIPLGVLIFFVAYLTVALGFGMRFEPSQA